MVKQVNTNPVIFNPTAKTLDFSAWNSFDIRRLMAVINDKLNNIPTNTLTVPKFLALK